MKRLRPLAQAASIAIHPLGVEELFGLFDPVFSRRQLRGVVTEVVRETPQSATIYFRPGYGWRTHKAGQWARIGVEINGVRHWRSYSISSAPGQHPSVTVTDIGEVSSTLVHNTRVGDVLFLAPAQGEFTLPEEARPLLMMTAGSGITPVMSMIRTLIPHQKTADVVLIHSARTEEDSLFVDELRALSAKFPGLRLVENFTAESGRFDMSTPAQLDAVCPDWRTRAAYVCGPEGFVSDAEALWTRSGTGAAGLTIERFHTDLNAGEPGAGGLVTFELSDKEVEADGESTLLEIGEDAGILMPSGCRMGICHSCLTPLRAGQVRDLRTGEVHGEPGELIQTCVSAAAGSVNLGL
ncbi:ferredoxin reductase [Neomicrococcus lactis]|uniref:Ferredoxin-NADP reductase n=1 Tax=Neomicrococcus lactis TaxID=732241 RepID=A0A7W8YCS0_9MICC|nr:ferredoxin reductase [Neomicrococcus lactis]MBB5599129.1 ferredoxin-NADP reductase [Neomicrococcus lactis]